MTKRQAEPCALFARQDDDKRLLYVPRDRQFPSKSFSASEWRAVAIGVDLLSEGRVVVRKHGFYEVELA